MVYVRVGEVEVILKGSRRSHSILLQQHSACFDLRLRKLFASSPRDVARHESDKPSSAKSLILEIRGILQTKYQPVLACHVEPHQSMQPATEVAGAHPLDAHTFMD